MARALFAWEHGGDLGPVRRQLRIARELRALGHETAFAYLDLAPLGAVAGGALEWFQAPVIPPPAQPTQVPVNASELLLNRGLGDPASVLGSLRGWLGMYDLWKPDILIAESAPAALLAARAAGLRHVTIGSGFGAPSPHDPMPALLSWKPPEEGVLRRADARLLEGVRGGFERIGAHARAPATTAEIFAAQTRLLSTWPELDPFGMREDVEYLGAQDDAGDGAAAEWRSEARPRVFAYLKLRDPRFLAILEALRTAAGESIVAVPGLSLDDALKLSSPTLRVRTEALALRDLLPGADLCLCHGTPGIVARALEAGVPLAMLPMYIEHLLVARRVASAGAGVIAPNEGPAGALAPWLAQTLANTGLREAAAASPLRGRPRVDAAARIANALSG